MNDEEDRGPNSVEPPQATNEELDAHEDAMAYVALRGAVKPDDLAVWEVQKLCQAFLRHLHKSRSE